MIATIETRNTSKAVQTALRAVETGTHSRCCHHWLIEKTDGPFSRGICRYCHEEREFKNTIPISGDKFGRPVPVRSEEIVSIE